MKKTVNSNKQINKSYQSHIKTLLKGQHEKDIFDSLSAGKNSYLRMDRLASSSFDKSWIEMIEDVIFDLGDIIANPRQHTKVTGVLTPVELARKITSESVQHLASHTQYIKEVDEYGNVIPSKLLSMSSDDDLHTYENRFIATFVRRLMLFITKRYEYVTKFAELRNEEVLYIKNKSIVDGAEVEIETKVKVSYKNEDEEAQVNSSYVDRIIQTRQYILYFYNSPFMKAMKNERDVRNPIVQTNIIRKNPKYHHCYEVYRFIETYDRLGVNYKIDENYSLFNKEELNELNRTLFANYITLKGNVTSKDKKTNSKVYKPKILTSLEDESFIYGPLLEGPIAFARVDDGYLAYLESKLKKDLPLHPTKKEREYYDDEFKAKAELKQDEKQLNDLMKRRQKEVNAFEKSVKNILAKREEARLKLLEDEKAAIKQEEMDLIERARQEIIAASKEDQESNLPQEDEKANIDQKFKDLLAQKRQEIIEASKEEMEDYAPAMAEPPASQEEKKVYTPTVSFEQAMLDIWPQLAKKEEPLPKEEVKPEPKKAKKEQPKVEDKKIEAKPEAKKEEKQAPIKEDKKPAKPVSKPVSFEQAMLDIWPQLNKKPEPQKEKPAAPKKETPKKVVPTKKSRKTIKKK